jgi:hypothetical protein
MECAIRTHVDGNAKNEGGESDVSLLSCGNHSRCIHRVKRGCINQPAHSLSPSLSLSLSLLPLRRLAAAPLYTNGIDASVAIPHMLLLLRLR